MSCVYFAEQVGGSLVKIGYTAGCPKRRVQSLQTGSPVKIRLAGTIPAESPELEKQIHQQFAAQRVKGEWFRRSKELMAMLPKKPRPARVINWSLCQYVNDRLRYGLMVDAFTVEQIRQEAGTHADMVTACLRENDPVHSERRAKLLTQVLDALDAPLPNRRNSDAANALLVSRKWSSRKAGAA